MNTPTDQFRAALQYLIDTTEGVSQAEIADATETKRSYINDFLKGRAPGKEDARLKWANFLGRDYKLMLSLGEWVLDQKHQGEWETQDDPWSKGNRRFRSALKHLINYHHVDLGTVAKHAKCTVGEIEKIIKDETDWVDLDLASSISSFFNASYLQMMHFGFAIEKGGDPYSDTELIDPTTGNVEIGPPEVIGATHKLAAPPKIIEHMEGTSEPTKASVPSNNYMTQTEIAPRKRGDTIYMELSEAEATLVGFLRLHKRDDSFVIDLIKFITEPRS